MITETKYAELLSKLDSFLSSGAEEVSPTSKLSGSGDAAPDKFLLTPEMNVEALTENEVLLSHALLHKFYASGGTTTLNRTTIEQLHKKVKERITSHQNFDRLDTVK